MSKNPQPSAPAANPLFRTVVRGAAVGAALLWLVVLLGFLAALGTRSGDGSGLHALEPLVHLLWATPIFIVFVVPALIFSFQRDPTGARIGAGLLLGAIAVVAAVYAAPHVLPLLQ